VPDFFKKQTRSKQFRVCPSVLLGNLLKKVARHGVAEALEASVRGRPDAFVRPFRLQHARFRRRAEPERDEGGKDERGVSSMKNQSAQPE
jgi:hypothetical protein